MHLRRNEYFRKTADKLQLDRPLAYALLSRLWQACTGPITILLIVGFLTEAEQGVYYCLVPIIGIQAFFELGLLNVLISKAGHAYSAYLTVKDSPQDLEVAAGRLGELIRASRRWFSWASVLFAITSVSLGWSILSQNANDVAWRTALLAVVPLAAITVSLSSSLAILEGAGQRELVYRVRFYQAVCGGGLVWLALALGWGIWALVLASGVQAIWSAYLVRIHQRHFFRKFENAGTGHEFSWLREVLPIQWRAALSGLALHAATQFLTLCIMTFHSASEAGQLGITLSITTAIQMLAMAWVQTKYPLISEMHGRDDREKAGTLWRQTSIVSSGLLCVALASLVAAIALLPLAERGWEQRFAAPWIVFVLGMGCLANHVVALQGIYVLARGDKPFVVASVVGLSTTTALVWTLGYYYSIAGVVIGFTAGMTFAVLPLHSWQYWQFRR